MRGISLWTLIIMIHSGLAVFAMAAVLDFNKEIELVSQDQYEEHLATVNKTRVTEAAVDFENKFRAPSRTKSVTFFPMKIKPKPFTRPKTKVAAGYKPKPLQSTDARDVAKLYKEQIL